MSKLENLLRSADEIVLKNAATRVNGKVASNRTQEFTRQVVGETCRRLHRLGYYLESVGGLREKHLDAIVRDWHAQGLSNKTMQNQYSRLKIFCEWAGKSGIVSRRGFAGHLPGVDPATLKVMTCAEKSKSWSGRGVDLVKEIVKARIEDRRWGAMLLMGVAFGLRKKEMLRLKPWKADKDLFLEIDGNVAKNGKFRAIPVMGEEYGKFQRWCLDEAKRQCKKTETLGWPGLSYKQSENRFYHLMKKHGFTGGDLGITAHGLRAEFAENMALLSGLLPPSLGGDLGQSKELREEVGYQVSHLLGHGDLHTIGAYYGSFRVRNKGDGRGKRVGTLVLDAETDLVAAVYVNPGPVADADGSYRKQSEVERLEASVLVIEERAGVETKELTAAQWVAQRTEAEPRLKALLGRVGLF